MTEETVPSVTEGLGNGNKRWFSFSYAREGT